MTLAAEKTLAVDGIRFLTPDSPMRSRSSSGKPSLRTAIALHTTPLACPPS
jgi:hypothetical protein